MPNFAADADEPSGPLRLLVLGKSGAGKTGALASLLLAGYRVWLIACETGVPVLKNLIRDTPEYQKIDRSLLNYITITNSFAAVQGKTMPISQGWAKFHDTLARWEAPPKIPADPYWLYTLTDKDVVVIDTNTGLSDLAKDHYLASNGRGGGDLLWKDFAALKSLLDPVFRNLTCSKVKAHVIVNCHIQDVKVDPNDEKSATIGYPTATSKALAVEMGRHFNNTLLLEETPSALGPVRKFRTDGGGQVKTKTEAPGAVKKEYPINTGLADYFKHVLEGNRK